MHPDHWFPTTLCLTKITVRKGNPTTGARTIDIHMGMIMMNATTLATDEKRNRFGNDSLTSIELRQPIYDSSDHRNQELFLRRALPWLAARWQAKTPKRSVLRSTTPSTVASKSSTTSDNENTHLINLAFEMVKGHLKLLIRLLLDGIG
jgi:hypothetical protein